MSLDIIALVNYTLPQPGSFLFMLSTADDSDF